ncbi:hypothetical protein HYW18_00885 [Candidatus Uhrbacteria bacterium]|nr:hypothetical protein [Candidatus Uhrbacteria bacterium]
MLSRLYHLKDRSETARILSELSHLGEAYFLLMSRQGRRTLNYYGYDGLHIAHARAKRKARQQALDRLRRLRFIKTRRAAKKYEVAITEKGWQEIFRLRVFDADLLPEEKMCMVVFDIPESHRSLRKLLRGFLESAGFMPIQRSVWISPFDAAEPITDLFRKSRHARWIRVFTVEEHC